MPIFKDLRLYGDLKLPMPAVLVLLTRDASCTRRRFGSWRRFSDSIATPIFKDLRLYGDLKFANACCPGSLDQGPLLAGLAQWGAGLEQWGYLLSPAGEGLERPWHGEWT